MQRILTVPLLANLYVCDRRSIVKDIVIISRKLSPEDAKRKALVRMNAFRNATGGYAALEMIHGLQGDGKAYRSRSAAIEGIATAIHEQFHALAEAARMGKKSPYPPLEESAAYAYETVAAPQGRGMPLAERRKYCRRARNSVRFLSALDSKGHGGMLRESMAGLCDNTPQVIAGDRRAIAISLACDFAFYLECVALLRRWGVREGKKMLLEAVGVSADEGADAGRRFLLGRITPATRGRIEASYGVDLHGFRFRSLESPHVKYDTWEW